MITKDKTEVHKTVDGRVEKEKKETKGRGKRRRGGEEERRRRKRGRMERAEERE